MNTRTTENSTNALPLTDQARQELEAMLGRTVLTPGESILERGRHVDLVISVWDSEESEDRYDALVSAFSPGWGRFRLEGVDVIAQGRAAGEPVEFPSRQAGYGPEGVDLTAQGRAPGEPVEVTGAVTGRGDIALSGLRRDIERYSLRCGRPHHVLRLAWVAEGYRTQDELTQHEQELRQGRVFTLEEDRIVVTVRKTAQGDINVAAETRDGDLAGAIICFALKDRTSGRVLLRGERKLPRQKNTPDCFIDSRPVDPPLPREAFGPLGHLECEFKAWVKPPEN